MESPTCKVGEQAASQNKPALQTLPIDRIKTVQDPHQTQMFD